MTEKLLEAEMGREKAEGIIAGLLQKECRQVFYDSEWDWDSKSQQLVYVSTLLEERKPKAELFYKSVSVFDLSPKACAIAWWPLLEVELVVETCCRVVEFANSLQVVDEKIDTTESLVPQIIAWHPKIAQQDVNQDDLHETIGSELAEALLYKAVGNKEVALGLASEFISRWLESGLVALVDGSFYLGGYGPPKREPEHSLPMSFSTYSALENIFPWEKNDEATTDVKRAQSIKVVIDYFEMNKRQLDKLVREALATYSGREYASAVGMANFIRRVQSLDCALPAAYRKVLSVATKRRFGNILLCSDKRDQLKRYLSDLRFVCDAYDFTAIQRDYIIRALWNGKEAQYRRHLEDEAHVIEILYDGVDRSERIQRLIEGYLNGEERGYHLSMLFGLAKSNNLPLAEELQKELESLKERKEQQGQEFERERAEAQKEAQAVWENNLQLAVRLLEKEPNAGHFLVESHSVKPVNPIEHRCVIATSTTASLHLGGEAETILSMLRAFRDSVIQRLPKGDALIAHYDKTAPPVARWVAENRLIRASFWHGFIRPSIYLLKQRKTRLYRFIVNFAVTAIFLAGLAWTTVLHFFAPRD